MKKLINTFVVGIFMSLFSITTYAVNVPHTFSANTPAVAADVNANFTALSNAVDTNASNLLSVVTALDSAYRFTAIYFTFSNFSSIGPIVSDVVVATCPAGSLLVGGGVQCSSDAANFNTTNFGVVNATIPVGNSIIGACTAEALTYSAALLGPPVTARAVCLSPAIIPPQAAGVVIVNKPSAEAQEVIDSLTNQLIKMQDLVGSRP